MRYIINTGRLKGEAEELMFYDRTKASKDKKIVKPTLKFKRCITKGCGSLAEKFKIFYNKKYHITNIKPAIEKSRVMRGALYTAAAFVMCFVLYGSVMALDLTAASTAMVDGHTVGVVTDKAEFEQFYKTVHGELAAEAGDIENEKTVSFFPCIASGKGLTDEYTLRQNIMALYDSTAQAYAVYADGSIICASFEEKDVTGALDSILKSYGGNGEFVENVEVKREYVTTKYLKFGDNIKKALTAKKTAEGEYIVGEGETLWEIAASNNMSLEQLEAKNPGINENVAPGTKLNVTVSAPRISVRTKKYVEGNFAVSRQVETVYDGTMAKGKTEIESEGSDGVVYVKKDIISINGEEVDEKIYEEKTVKPAVKQVVRVGTRRAGLGTGEFIRPTYGSLSSRYGPRWNRQHQGIDIAASTGTDIYAADDGVVEYSDWETGYGYVVKINHSNGYVTYYGHCSALIAKAGDVVEKGDLIAKVGSTGNSTGPHLHFEVRLNNIPQNPLEYINAN